MQIPSVFENSYSSCLTDRPIQDERDDNLRTIDYANALCNFIINADTPVTIGIQGGWGSGKTSLIKVLLDLRYWTQFECSRKTVESIIRKNCNGFAYDFSWNKFSLAASLPFEESEFGDRNKTIQVIRLAGNLYEAIMEVRKQLGMHLQENPETDGMLSWLNFRKKK